MILSGASMRDDRISITEMFRPFVDSKQQFLGLGEAWVEFLSYLKKRRGADIRTFRRMEEIDRAMSYVADALLDEGNADEVDREWFSQFERRQDVTAAFQSFIKHRGLAPAQVQDCFNAKARRAI